MKQRVSFALVVFFPLIVFFFFQSSTLAAAPPSSSFILNTPGPVLENWWQSRHRENILLANTMNPESVFFGDSITDHWRDIGEAYWSSKIAPTNALNLAIGGDKVQHIIWRIRNGEWGKMRPKLAFIMAGSNNIGADTEDDIAGWLGVLKDIIRKRSPGTKVVFFGVLPRGDKNIKRILRLNEKLKQMSNGKNVFYIDIAEQFLDTRGSIRTDLMPDRVHPNEEGYKIWADIIRSLIDGNNS